MNSEREVVGAPLHVDATHGLRQPHMKRLKTLERIHVNSICSTDRLQSGMRSPKSFERFESPQMKR